MWSLYQLAPLPVSTTLAGLSRLPQGGGGVDGGGGYNSPHYLWYACINQLHAAGCNRYMYMCIGMYSASSEGTYTYASIAELHSSFQSIQNLRAISQRCLIY